MKSVKVYLGSLIIIISLWNCNLHKEIVNAEDSYVARVNIDDPLHLAHQGKITFMEKYVSISEYSKEDMITSIDIPEGNTDEVDLMIRVFFDNTLTNYLKELDPNASINELIENGNYQFSFIVDNQLIYTEDLNSGAGSPESKNSNTSLCIPLYSSNNADSWGRFMWSRFLHRNGGEEALSIGSHDLEIEIRPYLKMDTRIVGDIIAKGNIKLNIIDENIEINEDLLLLKPIKEGSGFSPSKKEINEKYIKELKRKILNNSFKEITSIVIVENQKLIVEEYFNGSNRNAMNDTRSVGKSITSTLVGLAIDKGYLEGVEQKLSEFYDLNNYENYSDIKANISIGDLLTMTSAFDGDDEDSQSKGGENYIQEGKNWFNSTMNLPIVDRKNREWHYFTMGTMILSDILNRVTPNGLEQFAREYLFDPIGIDQVQWFHTPKGIPYGGGGLQLSSLDLAKIGSLYTNNGVWNGQQIISNNWINASSSYQVGLPEGRWKSYGYLWYNDSFSSNNKTYEVTFAAGNGGNFIYVFDELDIVVVITAKAYNMIEGGTQGKKILEGYVLPALGI